MKKKSVKPIPFDPLRRAAPGKFERAIDSLVGALEIAEEKRGLRIRQRREIDARRFRLATEVLSCNLLVTAMATPGTTLIVPREHGAMWGNRRYQYPVYGKHFLDLLTLMEMLKLIATVKKGYRFSSKSRQPTTIRPLRKLARHLPLDDASWNLLTRAEAPEVILLKSAKDVDGNAEPIDYPDTARTRQWRHEVRTMNAMLNNADVAVVGSSRRVLFDGDSHLIDPQQRSVRRVFNNGRWDAGGRLFGGFWMNMERVQRFKLIRVSGEPISNVDYGSLFPRLAYVRAQADQPDGDLYDIDGSATCRDGWKKLMNSLLFAVKPLRQWPTDTRGLLPVGLSVQAAVAAVKAKHAPIAHLFERGMGFNFMRIESDALVCIVTGLFQRGIVALPLHDSVLVAKSKAAIARRFMENEFKLRTGLARAFVTIESGPS